MRKTFIILQKSLLAILAAAVTLSSAAFFALPQPAYARLAAKFIVKLKSPDPKILLEIGGDVKKLFVGSQSSVFVNTYEFSSNLELVEIQKHLGKNAVYVQPDFLFEAEEIWSAPAQSLSAEQPQTVNDPGFTSNYLNVDKQWGLPAAGFDYAWTKTTGSVNNVVAIIDTGVDATHQDLLNLHLVPGYDFIKNKNIEGRINSDDNGHGTLVAGVLGASANNGIGVVGTNWLISVMPVKALDQSGKGDSSSVAEAIVWAADHGANFINLSFGGIGFAHDVALSNAVDYAFNKGVVIVAAAGNDTSNSGIDLGQEPVYPVCDDNGNNEIIGVAATDQNDLKPDFSNFGSSCVDVTAPGKRILSTINYDPLNKTYAPNSYAYASGTSLAVPYVVGEAALLRALYPQISHIQIRDQILSTADPIDNNNLTQCSGHSCRGLLGAGRINAKKAIYNSLGTSLIKDNDLVSLGQNQQVYQLVGSQKRPVSQFVLNQRFSQSQIKTITSAQLANFSDGPNVLPSEDTLVKAQGSPAVYIIKRGQKQPITYQIFRQRNFDFARVAELPQSEISTWQTGSLLPPSEGSVVKAANKQTIYWVVGETLHPVNGAFYAQTGLKIFPLLLVSANDLSGFAQGEPYIR